MLTTQQKELDKIYHYLADSLSISNTMAEKAIKSYNAVGEWLGNCEPSYDIRIMPQGSFNLGTVIRPLADEDDGYDIDLVCLLKNGYNLDSKSVKNTVGKRLNEHRMYKDKLEPEGKRCWTLNYEGFHMDILPCVPKYESFIEPALTDIRITHKLSSGDYISKYSNPYGYHAWFEDRMRSILLEAKQDFSIRNQVEIDEVPTSKVRTPLQKSIQILKRHRDMVFQDNDDAPISIIITTLAAQAYRNEANLFDALTNILNGMESYIQVNDEGKYLIPNPAISDENFADKWNDKPQKAKTFFTWIKQAKKDIIAKPLELRGLHSIGESLSNSFGTKAVERAYINMGEDARILREDKKQYISGLSGGLTNKPSLTTKKIAGHTFFGK